MRIASVACPRCWQEVVDGDTNPRCRSCHDVYPFTRGVPSLPLGLYAAWEPSIRARGREMRRHPWVVLKMSVAACTWLPRERQRWLQSLPLGAGDLVLDHCTVCGGNLSGLRQ